MSINVYQILNSKPNDFSEVIRDNLKRLQEASKSLNESKARFKDGIELQNSGLSYEYSRLTGNLTRLNGYEVASSSAKIRFEREFELLNQINEIVTQFKVNDVAANTSVGKSRADFANEGLQKIQHILNTNIDGDYFFGGVDSKTPPCLNDLTQVNNIVNGLETSNYASHVAPNIKKINISDLKTVTTGISAVEEGIKNIIAGFNYAKASQGAAGAGFSLKADKAFQLGRDQINHLMSKIGASLNDIEDANDYNKASEIQTKGTIDEYFSINIAEASDIFLTRKNELMMSMQAIQSYHKTMSQLFSYMV